MGIEKHHVPMIVQSGDTLYQIVQSYHVSVESILAANPGIDPRYLRVGQRLCIPSACAAAVADSQVTFTPMHNDINQLKAESNAQQIEESNYGTSTQISATDRLQSIAGGWSAGLLLILFSYYVVYNVIIIRKQKHHLSSRVG